MPAGHSLVDSSRYRSQKHRKCNRKDILGSDFASTTTNVHNPHDFQLTFLVVLYLIRFAEFPLPCQCDPVQVTDVRESDASVQRKRSKIMSLGYCERAEAEHKGDLDIVNREIVFFFCVLHSHYCVTIAINIASSFRFASHFSPLFHCVRFVRIIATFSHSRRDHTITNHSLSYCFALCLSLHGSPMVLIRDAFFIYLFSNILYLVPEEFEFQENCAVHVWAPKKSFFFG